MGAKSPINWYQKCRKVMKERAVLSAENEELHTRLAGRTYFHSDKEVERELAEVKAALEGLRKDYDLNNCRANKAEAGLAEVKAENARLRTCEDYLAKYWAQDDRDIAAMEEENAHLKEQLTAMQKVVDAARVVFGPNRPVTAVHKNQLALQDALADYDNEVKG